MAGSKTGTPSVVRLARRICAIVGVWGAGDLAAKTTPEFAAAVFALIEACHTFEALDDFPMQIDRRSPFGKEDIIPA